MYAFELHVHEIQKFISNAYLKYAFEINFSETFF